MLPLPENYNHSICEIKTLENDLVATGVISAITDEHIQIKDKSGDMSIVNYGEMVKINVFNFRLGFRVLVGKVYLSTKEFIRVVEITSLLDYERRNFFRVETNLKGSIKRTEAARDEDPVEVRIRDLSLGGAMIACKETLEIGERMTLRLRIGHLNAELPCSICRIGQEAARDNLIRYGCEFDNLSEAQNGALCAYVFQRQREQINKSKQ